MTALMRRDRLGITHMRANKSGDSAVHLKNGISGFCSDSLIIRVPNFNLLTWVRALPRLGSQLLSVWFCVVDCRGAPGIRGPQVKSGCRLVGRCELCGTRVVPRVWSARGPGAWGPVWCPVSLCQLMEPVSQGTRRWLRDCPCGLSPARGRPLRGSSPRAALMSLVRLLSSSAEYF